MRRWILVGAWLSIAGSVGSLGVGGGVSLPEGDLGDAVITGWHALATAELASPMHPWGLRLDIAYNRFAFSDEAEAALGGEGNQSAGSATLNVLYRLPKVTSPVQPYVIAGLGAYRTECSFGPGCDSRVPDGPGELRGDPGAPDQEPECRRALFPRHHRNPLLSAEAPH